jgi:hypothetical protein
MVILLISPLLFNHFVAYKMTSLILLRMITPNSTLQMGINAYILKCNVIKLYHLRF